MTDYDIKKVSPRPWVVHRHPEYGFSETDGNKFTGVPILRAENRLEAEFLHAVHCVNIHDELVAALAAFVQSIDIDGEIWPDDIAFARIVLDKTGWKS